MTTDDPIDALYKALAQLPDNLPLRRQLAAELFRVGRYDEAIAAHEAVLARAPDDAPSHLGLARARYEIGQYAEALEHYDRAVAQDVGLADAALRERILAAKADPRARIRLVAGGDGSETPRPLEPGAAEKPTLTFADVGGLDELKEKIRLRILYPLKRPDLYQAFGKKIGGGLLFYGPPGVGKTYLARATAGEAGIDFIAVGIEDVLDMWLGQSEKKLHELFAAARRRAPAILFFDEVDALGGRRSGLRHESYRTLVTQFLAELDGVKGSPEGEGVLVMGATNAPWDVDSAFRRPGRFGEVLFVPPPDLRARVEIFKLKLQGKPVAAELDVAEVARQTELFSGADLDHLVETAVEAALAASLKTGAVRSITSADLLAAVKKVRPTTLEWFGSAKNFATYANETGQYDEVLEYLRRHRL